MNLEEFKKGSFDEWFMPLWSNEELLQYRDHFYPKLSKEVVNRLFDHWNGLIRYVISKPADYKAKELNDDVIVAKVDEFFDDAINKSNVNTLGEYLYGRDNVKSDVEISNKIILLNISTSTFEKEDVFMTYHARKQVIAQLDTKSQEELLNMIYTITSTKDLSNKISTKLDGLFEELAGEILAAGRTLCVRKMVDYGQEIPKMIKISFPKRTKETANYKSNAAQAKQGAEKANEKQTKGIVSTIQEYDEFTKILFRINHSFPTFDYVCYFNESISNDNTVEKGPCTFQMTVGNTHSNNVTWDSYNLFHSLYSSSNERKIKHFIVVPLPNFEKFTYKNDFQTSDKKLIEYLFENAPDKDKGNVSEDEKKRIANKVLSEKFKQCVDQYCLNIDYRIS